MDSTTDQETTQDTLYERPTQDNWLTSQIKNSKVAAIFSETMLCRIGMHQGTWTTEGCRLLAKAILHLLWDTQKRERHYWPPPDVYDYLEDGSCKQWVTCWVCKETKFAGIHHEGQISFWNRHCKRCGQTLSVDGP
jgi:hypothetical protein